MGHRLNSAKSASTASRHLRWESFEQRINDGPPSVEPIKGVPRVVLFIEPIGTRIGVRFFAPKSEFVSSPLAEVTIREIGVGAETALEVSVGNKELYRDFYSLCCSIADRVQLDKQPVAAALVKTLRSWSALTRRKSLLSENRQVGLLGELLFLQRIAKSLGWTTAAEVWYGPDSEEHDFVLPAVDIEVKATIREQRVHHITSLTQLLPKMNRKLFLVSVQLTPAGNAKNALSLPQMVASVLSKARRNAPDSADSIREQLQRQGWDDQDAPDYGRQYHLRAPLLAAEVDNRFPAVIPATLSSLSADRIARIEQVSYSVNVDGLGVLDGTRKFENILMSH